MTREVEVALSADAAARVTLTVRSDVAPARATMRSPLGVVFEDVDGDIVVVEFYDESERASRSRSRSATCWATRPGRRDGYPKLSHRRSGDRGGTGMYRARAPRMNGRRRSLRR